MFSIDNVITAQTQLLTFRFKENHDVEEIREAMRYMFSIYPKLRSVVEPTLFSYRFRVLDDNSRELEVLFNDAFRVVRNMQYNSKEYIEYRRNLINEPFSLEQGLPIKIRYIPDDPTPVLLLSMHHIACDGVGWFHMENSLLKYLNGKHPPEIPIDNPSLLPALLNKPYYTAPMQLYRSFKIFRDSQRKNKGHVIIPASSRPTDFFGPVGVHQHFLTHDLKKLKSKSKEIGYSINVLHLTALTMALSRGPGKDKGNVVGIMVSMDLRTNFEEKKPVFGNYVVEFMVRTPKKYWDNPKEILHTIDEQLKLNMQRVKNKEIVFPLFVDKLFTLVGKKNYARGARQVKKKGLLQTSCAFSTLGNIDFINSHGTKAQVCETMSIVPQHCLFVTSSSLDGKTNTNVSYPEDEFAHDDILEFIKRYEQAMGELLTL